MTRPTAAPAHFPYHHRNLERIEQDLAAERVRSRKWRAARKERQRTDGGKG